MMSLSSFSLSIEPAPPNLQGDDEDVFIEVEQMPQFQDHSCMTFSQWVRKNMKYPKDAKERKIEGTVVASFIVDTLGNVTNIELLREIDQSLAEATIELLKKSPKWKPGEDNGVKRKVRFVIPISYKFSHAVTTE